MVNCRRQRNYIHSIRDRNGGILTERRQIGDRLNEFFEETMTTSEPDLMSQIFNVQAPCLDEGEKLKLLSGVDNGEIVAALKHMKPSKTGWLSGLLFSAFLEFGG
ncbi:hypothetical protein IFM89_030485 [Coptis chinensis]|uniref:Uncharacterized protein n=1 Tax=Coptis chinensis TaxID=261450 RepID=A0A835LP37_9MAGN|nr:hypothetical protein IFM89_030485 [Coptis chinensis]